LAADHTGSAEGAMAVVFTSHRGVIIVCDAGTPQETRREVRVGGDFVNFVLMQPEDRGKAGDEILCELFDEPRVITRIDPEAGGLYFKARITPRSQWDRWYTRDGAGRTSALKLPREPALLDAAPALTPLQQELTSIPPGDDERADVAKGSDTSQAERSRVRSAWLDKQLSQPLGLRSDLDIANNGGPSYNTIRRYRRGATSTREREVRGLLAEVFKCQISEVPE
jgi:hypothetical protein